MMGTAYMRRSAQSKLFFTLTYLLLATILIFNRDGSWPKFKQGDHLTGLLGINAQGSDEETCDYEFSTWEEEEEHGEDCDNTICNGSCLLMGYGTQTSHCLTEEMCCCNYDTVPIPQPLPEVEPGNSGPDDLTPTGEGIPTPCEDTAMEGQDSCVHAACGQACQVKGFVLEVSVCYKTGICCCNNVKPCEKLLWLRYIGGTCDDGACKHMCHIAKFARDASSCFHQDLCCCKYG